MADDILEGSEIGLAFVIAGILLFVIEVFQPGFLIAVPGTVFIVLGILLSFGIVDGMLLLPIGLAVGLGSLYATMRLYQSLAPPDTPSEMSIETKIGETGVVTKEVIANERSGKVRINMEVFRATSEENIAVGAKVKVTKAEGITVTVVPEGEKE
jgi:membrane-bound ClpP family serine protease